MSQMVRLTEAERGQSRLGEQELQHGVEFAKRRAALFCRTHNAPDAANVESFAIQGALLAWRKWDPARNTKWSTLLHYWVNFYIQKSFEKTRNVGYREFHAAHTVVPSSDDLPVQDQSSLDGFRRVEFDSLLDQIYRSAARLHPRERAVIVERYVHHLTHAEIGKRLGISRCDVIRREKSALANLRTMVQEGQGAPMVH